MKKLLVAFDLFREGFEELVENFDVTFPPAGRDFTHEELLQLIPEYDVLCSVFDVSVDQEIIKRGRNLKLIANYAVGYNNIDVAFAQQQGITVTNTPKSVVEPTADIAMALLLDVTRTISHWGSLMRLNKDQLKTGRLVNLGVGISGKTLGIIGMGNIGKAFAKRAQACGMKILYNKRTPFSKEEEQSLNFKFATKEEIIQTADVVSLHTPYSKETHHLIGEKELKMMKNSAFLINTGRGALVDEHALVEALKTKEIAGAGLDVYEFKDIPLPELYELENVSMTPHIGTQTHDARLAMLKEMTDSVMGFFNGDRPVARVILK